MEKRALRVQAGAIRQVGKRTGKLARSIHVDLTLRPYTGAYIGSNVRYALMHHDGTKRHPIVAKPGRMLTFTSNGRRVYARKVLHPGTAANRFLTDQLIKAVR
jgi:phage gpG-like protein